MTLTLVHQQLLYGLAAGLTLKELAAKCGVGHKQMIRRRLQLRETIGVWDGGDVMLLRAAIAQGLVPPDVVSWPTDRLARMGGWIG